MSERPENVPTMDPLPILEFFDRWDYYDAIWWRCDEEYAPVTFWVRCNDLFYWASADAECITPEDIPELEKAFKDCEAAGNAIKEGYGRVSASFGPELFCARARGLRPQGAAYPKDHQEIWPLFDASGPKREVDFSNPKTSPSEVTDE